MTLYLRRFTKRNIAELKTWFSTEEEVLQWAGASLTYPVRDSDIKAIIKAHNRSDPIHEIWVISDHKEVMVGHLQIWYNRRLKQATLGRIAITPTARGTGYGYSLMRLAIEQAFSRPWINRIELRVYDHNISAIATYKKAGFIYEGTRRQSTPIKATYWNTAVMSLLRSEYCGFDKRTEGE